MTKLEKAFANKKAFIGFLTAGDPSIEDSEQFIYEMERAGAAVVEIGIPFSDPIAEGPVIQDANIRALSQAGGCSTDDVFKLVRRVRKNSDIPLVLLTYLNPVFKYGYARFAKTASEAGVDALIIPDLPYEEQDEILFYLEKEQIDLIRLIAPTSKNRAKMIAKDAKGYIYLVSSMGVTGVRSEFSDQIESLIEEIRSVTDTKIAVGFGINTPEQAKYYSNIADGVIVGSAIVKLIAQSGEESKDIIYDYVKTMVREMN